MTSRRIDRRVCDAGDTPQRVTMHSTRCAVATARQRSDGARQPAQADLDGVDQGRVFG